MCYKQYITKLRVGIVILFMFPFHCFSQDISGVWTGKLYNDTTKEYIPFELAINESNGKASGFSHTTFISGSDKNVGVKEVKIKIKDDVVFVEDEKFVYNNFPEPPPKGVKMFATLDLSGNNASDVLKGTWKTNATRQYRPLTGTILLEKKKKNPENTDIVKKLTDLGLANQLSFLSAPPNTVAINTKAREDSIRKQQEMEALAKARKAKEDSIRNQQEMEALAKAQKAKEDSIRKQQEMTALAKAQKAKEDSLRKQQDDIARANRIKLYHEQQAKEELERKRLAEEQLARGQSAKEQEAREELAKQQLAQQALANAQKSKDEQERQKRAQEELLKIQKANPTAAADLSNRKLETIRTVEIAQDSLVFSLYDNGAVDGDTVSVLINGKVIMPRVGLLERAINKTIYLTPDMGDSISVVMYAENLGSIPPNTGLLVIREGAKIYEIRFSGDLSKNSKIILVRKKKK
ncbi:MAG: hypothetical protein ABI366_01075 [Ginsengibacter sp.]